MNTSYHRAHGTIGSDYKRYRYIDHLLNCRSPGHLIVIWKTEIKPPLMFTNWWIFCHTNLHWWSTSFHHVHANLCIILHMPWICFLIIMVSSSPRLSEIRTHNVSGDRYWLHIAHKSILPYDHDHNGPSMDTITRSLTYYLNMNMLCKTSMKHQGYIGWISGFNSLRQVCLIINIKVIIWIRKLKVV